MGAVAEAFIEGTVYFRGQQIRPRDVGSAFGPALTTIATRVLPDLYPHFSEIAISPEDLEQLLEKELTGPSTHLRGREVASREQLKAVLEELEERIGALLDQGARVRLA